jgi:Tfp pilus assembly protein PilO
MASKRIYISVAISVALLTAWYLFGYHPQSAKMQSLNSEQESMHSRLDAAEARLKQAGELQSKLSESSNKWSQMRNALVGPDSVETMLKYLVGLAQRQNLTVLDLDISFDPLFWKLSNNQRSHAIDRINLDMSGRGRFFDIGDFVALLENDMIVADVVGINLTYQETANPYVYFDVNMEVFIVPREEQTL